MDHLANNSRLKNLPDSDYRHNLAPNNAATAPRRPILIRIGKKLRRPLDRLLATASLVPNEPILASELFDWIGYLNLEWLSIRNEAFKVIGPNGDSAPALRDISPDHARIAPDNKWRSFFLVGYGHSIAANLERCPATAAALQHIPGLNTAFFSVLQPGTHIPLHRGVTKGLLTFHLGLSVPSGPISMVLSGQKISWNNGESFVFDDTWIHEVHNDADEARIVLLVQFRRPMRWWGSILNRFLLAILRRTAFVKDAARAIAKLR